jgi:hypothetical protein
MKELLKLPRFRGDGKFFHCRALNGLFEVYSVDGHWCATNSYERGEQIAHMLNEYYEKYSYKLEEK